VYSELRIAPPRRFTLPNQAASPPLSPAARRVIGCLSYARPSFPPASSLLLRPPFGGVDRGCFSFLLSSKIFPILHCFTFIPRFSRSLELRSPDLLSSPHPVLFVHFSFQHPPNSPSLGLVVDPLNGRPFILMEVLLRIPLHVFSCPPEVATLFEPLPLFLARHQHDPLLRSLPPCVRRMQWSYAHQRLESFAPRGKQVRRALGALLETNVSKLSVDEPRNYSLRLPLPRFPTFIIHLASFRMDF